MLGLYLRMRLSLTMSLKALWAPISLLTGGTSLFRQTGFLLGNLCISIIGFFLYLHPLSPQKNLSVLFLGDCISLEIFWWKGCTRVIPIASLQMLNQSAWSPSLDPPPPSTGLVWRACLFSFLKKRNPPSLVCAAHEMGHQGRSHRAA